MKDQATFRRITVEAARKLMIRDDIAVLDARDAASYQRARIGSARHVSDANLYAILTGTPKSAPVLIYCYHGRASQVYAQTFADFGFREVYSLDGGFEGWCQAGSSGPVLSETLQSWLAEQGFSAGDIDAIAGSGTTPLMKASRLGQSAIVAELIRAGARLGSRNADGNNALWLACVGGDLDVIRLLIDAGINIDNRNDNGATCLMYAASTGKAQIVEHLLAAGADLKHKTLDDFTALDMAATRDCLRLLREAERRAGCNV